MSSKAIRRPAGDNRGLAARGCGIERAGYLARSTPDPEQAARFAADIMGFSLVHVDAEGRHYLAGHGLDRFSMVYVEGESGLDHVSFVVHDLAALEVEEERLRSAGAEVERIEENPLWRCGPAVRVLSPAGHAIQITPGVPTAVPMAAMVAPPLVDPAPISFDHIGVRATDPEAERSFAAEVLGLRESARIVDPSGANLISFYRSHTLYHCYTIVGVGSDELHHFQFTLKNGPAVHAAYERLTESGVDVFWGPVRHGPGHNVAIYFDDWDGRVVEYSAEEEIIPDNVAYAVQEWSTEDPQSLDEWGSQPPLRLLE